MQKIETSDIKIDDIPLIFKDEKPLEISNWLRIQFDNGTLFIDDKSHIRKLK